MLEFNFSMQLYFLFFITAFIISFVHCAQPALNINCSLLGHAHPRGKKGKTDCGLVKRCHFYTLDSRIVRLTLGLLF